jgi:hypothetical protein
MPFSELSEQQQALIANRTRVWEVRRFCQVLPSVIKYSRGADSSLTSQPLERHEYSQNEPDGALAALLRCLVHRIGVDLAMVSLLDDHTQYFVSGASRTNMNEVKVTLGEFNQMVWLRVSFPPWWFVRTNHYDAEPSWKHGLV